MPILGGDIHRIRLRYDAQPEPLKPGKLAGCLAGLGQLAGEILLGNRDAETGVGFLPRRGVADVVQFGIGTINLTKKADIRDDAGGDLFRILAFLPPNTVLVFAGGGDRDAEGLASGRARVFEHVPQLAIGQAMELIEDGAGGVQAIFRGGDGGIRDDDAAACGVDDSLVVLTVLNLESAAQHWRGLDHAALFFEDDAGLIFITCVQIDFGCALAVGEEQVQAEARNEGRFAVFLGDLEVCPAEAPPPIRHLPSEQAAEEIALPLEERERLACPTALGLATKRLDEITNQLAGRLVEVTPLLEGELVGRISDPGRGSTLRILAAPVQEFAEGILTLPIIPRLDPRPGRRRRAEFG